MVEGAEAEEAEEAGGRRPEALEPVLSLARSSKVSIYSRFRGIVFIFGLLSGTHTRRKPESNLKVARK